MTVKVRKLRAMIFGLYDSESDFAAAIGWSRQRLNKITNGIKEPDVEELNTLANGLKSSVGDIAQIFLSYKSPNEQQAG